MKKFREWYKEVSGIEPDYNSSKSAMEWCNERGLPMVVSCTCCESTLLLFSTFIDEENYTYCSSCAGVE